MRNRSCSRAAPEARGSDGRGQGQQREASRARASPDGPTAERQGRQQDARRDHAGHVLEDRPTEHRALRGLVRRPAAAARDVDDHDRRAEGHAEPEDGGRDGLGAEDDEDDAADERGDQHLHRRHPEQPGPARGGGPQVDLDADLEQEQDDADVGQQMELLGVGDVARRERRDEEADDEVADDGRQADAPRREAGCDGRQEDDADLEDGGRRRLHEHDGSGLGRPPGRAILASMAEQLPDFDLYATLGLDPAPTPRPFGRLTARRSGPPIPTSWVRAWVEGDDVTKRLNIARDWLADPGRRQRYDEARGLSAATGQLGVVVTARTARWRRRRGARGATGRGEAFGCLEVGWWLLLDLRRTLIFAILLLIVADL